jgi:tRNA pseudouridine55 synthase
MLSPEAPYSGEILCIDKPLSWTSFDVVNKLRYALKRKLGTKKVKVGHAGTLDPLATGLLIVCTSKKTKDINNLMGLPKVYSGVITLGASTPTYDLETEPTGFSDATSITEGAIKSAAASFVGLIAQIPPVFSAKKVDGKKSYELARKGLAAELKSVQIEISAFEIQEIAPSKHIDRGLDLHFMLYCSKGTYVRALARDLGNKLDCGGFLSALRREAIGDFEVKNALTPEQAIALWEGTAT